VQKTQLLGTKSTLMHRDAFLLGSQEDTTLLR
jgi:hypothetical protein